MSYLPEIHRMLPQAPDAERGLLCSFLINPEWVGGVCAEKKLTAEQFHRPDYATVFRVLLELWDGNKQIDPVTFTQVLSDRGILEQCGGRAGITDIFTYLPSSYVAPAHADIIQEKHTLRQIIRVCTEYAARGYDDQEDPEGTLSELEAKILGIRKNDDSELREQEPRELVMSVVDDIEKLYERKGAIGGLPTGLAELDNLLDGLHRGDMVVIAARPSMGKTALAMNIAEHIALVENKTVGFFTLEMSDKALMMRSLLSRSHINMHRVRSGFMSDGDFPRLTATAAKMCDGNRLRIVDAVGATIGAIRAKARRMKRKNPDLAAIFLDYIQKARSNSRQAVNSREREIAEISSGLKDLAKELNIPVVVLAQLNRDVEKRKIQRPQLSDLRESGAIEQDADVVGLLYREEYYATNEEEKRDAEGKATLIIAKHRNGPIGDVPLTFLKEFARFETRAVELREDPYAGKRGRT
jgi:replicative DNA helicase